MPKKKISSPLTLDLFGTFSRLLCFLGDLALGHSAYAVLTTFSLFRQREHDLHRTLSSLMETLPFPLEKIGHEGLSTMVLLFLLTQLLRLYGVWLMGVSFFQKWGGFSSEGNWFSKRVGGTARIVVDTLLGWTLLPYLPLILGRKGFPEKWTLTKLTLQNKISFLLLRFGGIPCCLFISLLSPLLISPIPLGKLSLTVQTLKRSNLNQPQDFNRFTTFSSQLFRIKSFSSLSNGRFILLPNYQIDQRGKRRKMTPYLSLYDRQSKSVGQWRVRGQLLWPKILAKGGKGNPLFYRSYPFRDEKSLSSIVQTSLQLDPSQVGEHALKHGPFLSGYLSIAHHLLDLLEPGKKEVDLVQGGDHLFLRFQQQTLALSPSLKQHLETWIPLQSLQGVVMEFIWDRDLLTSLGRKAFLESFLSEAQWFFDSKDSLVFPQELSQISVFQVLDSLTKKTLSVRQAQLIQNFLISFYEEMGHFALTAKAEHPLFFQLLKMSLKRVNAALKMNKAQENSPFDETFLGKMEELSQAIQTENPFYFKLAPSKSNKKRKK